MRALIFIIALCAPFALTSCSGDDGHDHSGHGHGDGTDGAIHDHDATDDTEMCKDADVYSIELSKATDAGSYNLRFVSADPGPPDVGENTWTIEVTDADGEVVPGLTLTAKPEMPHHGHGTSPPTFASVEATDSAGVYVIGPLPLHMSGFWETSITVTDGENSESVTFIFCLEG